MTPAYAGIDVAFAKKKSLPVVVCTVDGDRLVPLPLRRAVTRPPRGSGNAAIVRGDDAIVGFVEATAEYLRAIERECNVRIERIAIDAPSAARRGDLATRACEADLGRQNISFIKTPCTSDFERMRARALEHLASNGSEARIPAANQLWMLVGFALFERLTREWQCIEVYPQAIVRALGSGGVHKGSAEGLSAQLAAVSSHTGWPVDPTVTELDAIGFGSRHDRLDAYLSAWVASLPESSRRRFGVAGDEIWVPELSALRPGVSKVD